MDVKQAIKTQKELASRVVQHDDIQSIQYVAGIDVSNNLRDPENRFYAGIVVFKYPEIEVVERSCHISRVDFPYISGLLAFREAPVVTAAMEKLHTDVDVFMVDGHGVAHPRGLGIASHIGVLTGKATVGCAKSILVGSPSGDLGWEKGSTVPLVWKDRILGNVVRTKPRIKPVYVSVGHRVSLDTATALVLSCTGKYRLPEPTRCAHLYANEVRRQNSC